MPTRFLEKVLALPELQQAWMRVLANGGKAGGDGVNLTTFAAHLQQELQQLRREVLKGEYHPLPMLAVSIAKSDGGLRQLAIPAIRDRVLQTAFAQELSPILEPHFETCSYAYRPRRSIRMAVEAVLDDYRAGCHWILDGDIDHFFDNIEHSLLLEMLAPFLEEPDAIALLEGWLRGELLQAGERRQLWRGLPQGSPLSPLLSNLYLDPFDESLQEQGHHLIRYADDFVVLCKSTNEARQAMRRTRHALSRLELNLNEDKTRITDFRAGLDFLGVNFRHPPRGPLQVSSRWPALLPIHRQETVMIAPSERQPLAPERPIVPSQPEETFSNPSDNENVADPPAPLLHTLYVTSHGTRLCIEGERFIVKPLDQAEQPIPAQKVDLIILFGNVQVSTQAMNYCLKHGISLVLAGASGGLRGMLHACEDRFTLRQWQQFHAMDDTEFALRLARAMVIGKIGNSRTVLQRFAHKHSCKAVEPYLVQMASNLSHAKTAGDLDQLRGFEGAAAKSYFAGWRELIAPEWQFEGREKPAAADPINALLNLGYSMLHQNLRTLLAGLGLNPAAGFLHPPRDGHAALASDIMEEFRAVTVDTLVFGDILGGSGFHPDDFAMDEDAERPCTIKPTAMRRFLEKFEAKMNSPFSHPDEPKRLDYRRVMQRQCSHLAEVIANLGDYKPLRIR